MKSYRSLLFFVMLSTMVACYARRLPAQSVVALPPGVRAVWDLSKAYREATHTSERICINGLWRWQPAADSSDAVPAADWGYFKAPGCWPGKNDYMQKDSQTVFAHPSWRNTSLGGITAAWYQREITVPAEWTGRRISLSTDYLNSFAAVYVDGAKAGEMRFPAGDLDITALCKPGRTHVLSLRVEAMPLNAVMMSYTDTNAARQVKGAVDRRGLCGDVYLVGVPGGSRISEVKVETSVRRWEITFRAALQNLSSNAHYTLRARIREAKPGAAPVVETFTSQPFAASALRDGSMSFTSHWKPAKLWDTSTPENQYSAEMSLVDQGGKVLDDALPTRFGFREFWITGRDFYLNGTRIFLSAVPINNAQIGAALASYDGVRETFRRLKTFGVNMVYTHNYDCQPGAHLSFEETLRAADAEGVLISLSQPHFSQYKWDTPDADQNNGYAKHAAFYVHVAGNHPSVVFYSTSHNATEDVEDENPDKIGDPKTLQSGWASNNSKKALRAEAIIKHLDPSRIVYHHSSGVLSAMDTLNFYLNFVPIQEVSDWFQHWSEKGTVPLFTCEYGVPLSWDWTMYRGWYKGNREWGSAAVPWEFCLAEWNAQFYGDQAFKISDWEKDNLRWEAKQFRAGALWHHWDYPHDVDAPFDERFPIYASYVTDNLRAFRALGLSANNSWAYAEFWKLRPGADRSRKDLKVDWENLQRPGFSPDYIDGRMDDMTVAYDRSDWVPTVAAQALVRNNGPLLAYIGGKAAAVTSKDHVFQPGETIEKQAIAINNSRRTVTCEFRWALSLPTPIIGSKTITIETGQQVRLPISFPLPASVSPGRYKISLTAKFSPEETQEDALTIHVLPKPTPPTVSGSVALFDPVGETAKWLTAVGLYFQPVTASSDLSSYSLLIVGKGALTESGAAPDISRVRDGLKVVLFEQTSDVLEHRFGFRTEEYGLRSVFRRIPDHPALAGLTEEVLRDWRGDSTISSERLKYEVGNRYAPQVEWSGLEVTRLWRAGNRGNVASVLIEKPATGDFLPIIDGGYSLQYSPLMEYHEGKGIVIFCQMDVTGRTEADPAAGILARNIVSYASQWAPSPRRSTVYAGDSALRAHLKASGFAPTAYQGGRLSPDQVLVVGAGGGQVLASNASAVADFIKSGGNVLGIDLDDSEANAFLPFKVQTRQAEHIAAYFDPFNKDSLLAGVSPADIHNRDPHSFPLVSGGATVIGDGILAKSSDSNVIFDQLAPYLVGVDSANGPSLEPVNLSSDTGNPKNNIRRTYRRASFTLTRLLSNMGAESETPILDRFSRPVTDAKAEKRYLTGLYLDTPEEWDDPYRFFGW